MLTRIASVCLVFSLLLLAGGCTAVTFEKPLGTQPNSDLAKQLDGKWDTATSMGVVVVKHTHDNEVVVALTEWDKKQNAFKIRNMDGLVMGLGNQHILNLKLRHSDMEGEKADGWFVLRIKPSNNSVLAWALNGKLIEEMVEENRLKGEIRDKPDHVFVTETDAKKILELFSELDQAELWNMEEPLVARRLND